MPRWTSFATCLPHPTRIAKATAEEMMPRMTRDALACCSTSRCVDILGVFCPATRSQCRFGSRRCDPLGGATLSRDNPSPHPHVGGHLRPCPVHDVLQDRHTALSAYTAGRRPALGSGDSLPAPNPPCRHSCVSSSLDVTTLTLIVQGLCRGCVLRRPYLPYSRGDVQVLPDSEALLAAALAAQRLLASRRSELTPTRSLKRQLVASAASVEACSWFGYEAMQLAVDDDGGFARAHLSTFHLSSASHHVPDVFASPAFRDLAWPSIRSRRT